MADKTEKVQQSFTVSPNEAGQRLDVFLKERVAELSRERIKKEILVGHAKVSGHIIDAPSFKVSENDIVSFWYISESSDLQAEDIDLDIVYEDSDFVVVNKPAGMVVHPGAGTKSDTLANALLHKYPGLAQVGHPHRPGIVHRLDKDTSGLLLVARNNDSLAYARKLFKTRQVRKEYLTLVSGHMENKRGTIEKPIKLDHVRRRVVVDQDGKPAKTEYKVLQYYGYKGVDQYSFLRVVLHTGRTHQIRVHFAYLGHPVVGDSTYGKGYSRPQGLKRQFLHAYRLAFNLPDGTALDFVSELPQDLQNVLDSLNKIET